MIKDKKFFILVVEDDDFNFTYIQHIFHNAPFKVIRAKNGNEALNLFEKNNEIDLILMDLRLPDINGIEIIKKIRLKNSKIPIICQTASKDDATNYEAILAGCNEILIKPFSKELVIKTIKKYVEWKD